VKDEKTIKPTSIRLDPDIYDKLVELAKEDRRSITKEIEFIIAKHLEIRGKQ